jgi:hypothetical protein
MLTETPIHAPKKYSAGYPLGQVMPFASICEPGAYICNWSGHLLRVPADARSSGGGPIVNFVGPDNMLVTKVSENPYIPVTRARLLAADFGIAANF